MSAYWRLSGFCPSRLYTRNAHRAATMGTAQSRFGLRCLLWQRNSQYPLYDFQQRLGITMQKTIITCPSKSFGQNVQQSETNKIFTGLSPYLPLLGFAVSLAESDVGTIVVQNMAVNDHAAIQVTGEVLQRLHAPPHFLALSYPTLWSCLWLQAGFVQRMEKRSAKGASQRFAVKQIISPCNLRHSRLPRCIPPPGTTMWTCG